MLITDKWEINLKGTKERIEEMNSSRFTTYIQCPEWIDVCDWRKWNDLICFHYPTHLLSWKYRVEVHLIPNELKNSLVMESISWHEWTLFCIDCVSLHFFIWFDHRITSLQNLICENHNQVIKHNERFMKEPDTYTWICTCVCIPGFY